MSTPLPPGEGEAEASVMPRGASQLRIGWIMPPFFHELPVDAPDADTAAEQLRELATSVLPERPLEDQYAFALILGSQLEPMTEANVIYAGMSFLEVEGQPTSSTVLVSQFAHDSSEEDIVPTLVDDLSSSYRHDDVRQTDLPCGPAVSRIGSSPFAYEDPATGVVQTVQRNIIQTYVPLPDCKEILLFELGVYSAEGWDLHSEVFAEILKTLDWCTDQEIAETAMLAQRPPSAEEAISDPVRQELQALCAELIRVSTEQELVEQGEVRLSATTCANCWERGLRSSCHVVHEWRLSGMPEESLNSVKPRASSHLSGQGWRIHDEVPASDTLRAGTASHSATLTVEPSTGALRAEVSTSCARTTNTAVSDDFG